MFHAINTCFDYYISPACITVTCTHVHPSPVPAITPSPPYTPQASTAPILQQPPKLISDEWQQLLDLQAKGDIVEVPITAVGKGGATVQIGARTGFLPFLLMAPQRAPASEEAQADREQRLMGNKVFVKIMEVMWRRGLLYFVSVCMSVCMSVCVVFCVCT